MSDHLVCSNTACGAILPITAPEVTSRQCPTCGQNLRAVFYRGSASSIPHTAVVSRVVATERTASSSIPHKSGLHMKHVRPGFDKGRKKRRGDVVVESFNGDAPSRDPASPHPWIQKQWVRDRGTNRYIERITAPGGTVLHECDELLSEHYGHGAAKVKRGSASDQPEATDGTKQADSTEATD